MASNSLLMVNLPRNHVVDASEFSSVLLNTVRKRNYPSGSASLYKVNGSQLTDQEMIDEWGLEFLPKVAEELIRYAGGIQLGSLVG